MRISRHYLTIDGRRVHYRVAGSGPPLLMVHQSPRSSAEFDMLMRSWASHFTCIAPDTPGFGQSDPLPLRADGAAPVIDDFADAIAAFVRAVGLDRTAAYGFHSGGIILMTAMRRHPSIFAGMAIGGYAVWTDAERALFDDGYLPAFRPTAYGEHLTWLWSRILEQSWFFPWFDVRPQTRMSVAHADIARVHAAVMDMLDSGDAYRAGYGAVLRAPRDIPPPDADVPPVLITAYDGDPLQAHLARLGPLPAGWHARAVATPADHHAASLAFLLPLSAGQCPALQADDDGGFVHVVAGQFDGRIHWRRDGDGPLQLAPPGQSLTLVAPGGGTVIDPPGHGLSDDWAGTAPEHWAAWQAVADTAASALNCPPCTVLPDAPAHVARHFPDLTPDRFGAYLTRAWQIVRAGQFFDPWYAADAAHAVDFDTADICPDRLAVRHRALIQARSALPMATALTRTDQ